MYIFCASETNEIETHRRHGPNIHDVLARSACFRSSDRVMFTHADWSCFPPNISLHLPQTYLKDYYNDGFARRANERTPLKRAKHVWRAMDSFDARGKPKKNGGWQYDTPGLEAPRLTRTQVSARGVYWKYHDHFLPNTHRLGPPLTSNFTRLLSATPTTTPTRTQAINFPTMPNRTFGQAW